MATGVAIGVTVIGVAAILTLLGILARQLGFWTWAVNWLKATSEEKTKLCGPERVPTSSERPYLTNVLYRQQIENDFDWINLWPRNGSYKKFSNPDDINNSEDSRIINANIINDPPIPPQPLRPAPGPPGPHIRMPIRYDANDRSSFAFPASGMLMGMMKWDNRTMNHYNGFERNTPTLDRRDSDRSISSRNRKNLAQDYQQDIMTSSLPRKTSTNPFRSGLLHANSLYSSNSQHYSNPFAHDYQYQGTPRRFQAIGEDFRINETVVDDGLRQGYPSQLSRSDHHIYTNKYDEYSRLAPIHNQSLDRGIDRIHGQTVNMEQINKYNNDYVVPQPTQERVQNSSQLAYSHSLNQALAKQRNLQQNIQQQIFINRYDKIKKDEERINEEERILHQLRYENDLLRREQFKNSLENNPSYNLNSNMHDIEETRQLQREAIRDNLVYKFQKGASNIRNEFEKRFTTKISSAFDRRAVIYDINNYSSSENRDSPPPPAPDEISNTSYPDSPETPPKDTFLEWRDGKNSLEIPATPPNTASLTPPNTASISSMSGQMNYSMANPHSNTILHERLAQVEEYRYKVADDECIHEQMEDVRHTIDGSLLTTLNSDEHINGNDLDGIFPNVFIDSRDDNIGGELTQKLHALQEGKGIDVYPRALKDRIEKRRQREGSRRKRKRGRDLERRSSLKKLEESKSNKQNNMEINQINVEIFHPPTDNEEVNLRSEEYIQSESALNNVPIGLVCESEKFNEVETDTSIITREQTNALDVANIPSRCLGDSPVVPRKSFLSYKGSWHLDTNSNEEENETCVDEEDANTLRVREYIASMSARLQQLPEKEEETKQSPTSPSTSPAAISFPITPPNSAARTNSQSSIETPSSANATWGSVHAWRLSTETPPSSASGVSPRPSYSDIPSSSIGYEEQAPQNSMNSTSIVDTPPPSVEFPGTPRNSSSGEINESMDLSTGSEVLSRSLLKRAYSCDSVNSDSSITLGELAEEGGKVTGYLSVQIIYDGETADLEVVVVEGRDLQGPDPNVAIDSYVRVFLLPDKTTNMQTRIFKRSSTPSFGERFLFALEEEELLERCLVFYVYASDKFSNTLIGESHLKIRDMDLSSIATAELTLVDSGQRGMGHGEIMFSLAYLPTAERLTVVVVKARSLQFSAEKISGDPFVKVYILRNGKKILNKKTSVKKDTNSPVFNEAMSFNISGASLNSIQLRLTVAEYLGEGTTGTCSIGHVIVGTQASGKALSHWNQMMSSLRKPIGMWHVLRR